MGFPWGMVTGGLASLFGGALQKNEPPRRYPELNRNRIMALALARQMMNAPKYDWGDLPMFPEAPGLPDFATTLARARGQQAGG